MRRRADPGAAPAGGLLDPQLCEQLHYNLLLRWFVALAIDDSVWDHSSFSRNRNWLLELAGRKRKSVPLPRPAPITPAT